MVGYKLFLLFIGASLTDFRLDLSDEGRFFAVHAPIRALDSEFLKYAMSALAAKHLGRTKGHNVPNLTGRHARSATMATYPNASQVNWTLKAANYYYLAVSNMGTATSDAYASISTSAVLASPIETFSQWLACGAARQVTMKQNQTTVIEDLLATVTVLAFYKLLDAEGQNWKPLVGPLCLQPTNDWLCN